MLAKTDPDAPPGKACTAFVVDRDTPGITPGRKVCWGESGGGGGGGVVQWSGFYIVCIIGVEHGTESIQHKWSHL